MPRLAPTPAIQQPLIKRRNPKLVVLDRRRKLLSVLNDHWFQRFAGRYSFPRNYTTIDLETNGTNPEESAICSIGHTVVRDCKPVETSEVYLNWPNFPDIDHDAFQYQLNRAQHEMALQGKTLHHTWQKLKNEGKDPVVVLYSYLEMFEEMEQRREVLVAHNGWRFDIEMLQAHFHNWLHVPFQFDADLVFDTGISEKASQLEESDEPFPLPGETLQQFAWRIGDLRRRGIRWALDGYCDEQYHIFEKAGCDKASAHAAGTDSLVLHHLFEEHRKLAGLAQHVDLSDPDPQSIMVDEDGQSYPETKPRSRKP